MIIKHSRAEAVLQLGMGRRVGFVTTLRVCTGKDLVPSRMKKAKWSPSSVPCCQKTFKPSQGGNRYPFQKLRENRLQCCPSSPLQHGCFVKAYKTKLFLRSSVFCLLTLSAELLFDSEAQEASAQAAAFSAGPVLTALHLPLGMRTGLNTSL